MFFDSDLFKAAGLVGAPFIGWHVGARVNSAVADYGNPYAIVHHREVRPRLVQIGLAVLFAWTFLWELCDLGLPQAGPGNELLLGVRFCLHVTFFAFLVAAFLIDLDAMIIPDELTLIPSLLGFGAAFLSPALTLPDGFGGALQLTTPFEQSPDLKHPGWLALALGSFSVWVLAFSSPAVRVRPGHRRKRMWLWWHRTRSNLSHRIPFVISVVGALLTINAWALALPGWPTLLSALVGSAAGISTMWLGRIALSELAGREALGFGDVLLAGSLGAWLGWQGLIATAFFACVAVVPALLLLIAAARVSSAPEVPFGPFMVTGAIATVLLWPQSHRTISELLPFFTARSEGRYTLAVFFLSAVVVTVSVFKISAVLKRRMRTSS